MPPRKTGAPRQCSISDFDLVAAKTIAPGSHLGPGMPSWGEAISQSRPRSLRLLCCAGRGFKERYADELCKVGALGNYRQFSAAARIARRWLLWLGPFTNQLGTWQMGGAAACRSQMACFQVVTWSAITLAIHGLMLDDLFDASLYSAVTAGLKKATLASRP